MLDAKNHSQSMMARQENHRNSGVLTKALVVTSYSLQAVSGLGVSCGWQ
jgi:hypothetical protein